MKKKNVVAIDVRSAGRTPWRNPITAIGAARFEDGDIDGVLELELIPRPGSEFFIEPDSSPWREGAVSEADAMRDLSHFCWTGGKGTILVVHDIQGGYQFLANAQMRRSAAIILPDRIICLKTFAILIESHGLCKLKGLSIPDLYGSFFSHEYEFNTPASTATAIGLIYNELVTRAGW